MVFLYFRTRATSREEKNLQSFMEHPKEKWVESAYEVDGPHYYTVLALHISPPEKWKAMRVEILKRLLVTSHARVVSPGGASRSATTPPLLPSCQLTAAAVPGAGATRWVRLADANPSAWLRTPRCSGLSSSDQFWLLFGVGQSADRWK